MRTRLAILIGAAALSVSACAAANGAYGSGVGYAYGYGTPGFDCYNNGLYGYGGYGIGNCGWYDGFFYPGFGNFVFDRHHHRHNMTGHQHDYFTRQARGPGGGRRVGLGSSGGVVPPTVSRPQGMPGNSMGHGFGGPGPRSGFSGGARGGFGGSHGGMSGGGRHG